ncbi:MAG: PAS domain S-box protein, partial [Paludibacter sp.]
KVGVWIWIESKFTVQIDDSNEVFIIINFRDITEQRKANEELSQNRLNYETFFNTIDAFLFVLDVQGNIIHTNNTVNDRLLYSKEELLGKSVLEVHPADRREEAGKIVGEMLSGHAETCPVPIVTKSGVQIPVETRVTHGFWNGEPVIFGVTKDVSKVKLSEEKFSKVFHVNPSACGLTDMETHKYVEVNEAFYNMFGFENDEVLGKTASELSIISSETIQNIEAYSNESGSIYNVEAELRTKNGDIIHALLSAENINVQNKSYRFTVVQDITKRKLAEKNLRQVARLYALLGEINQAIVKYKNQKELFETICRVAIEHGQFRMGWLGIYDEVSGQITPTYSAGHSDGYLELLDIIPHSKSKANGPTARAYLEGNIVFCNDIANDPMMQPWKDQALKRGYQSSFAAPIMRAGKPYGTFTLYASEVGFFNNDEQKLLAEIGQNISYAIDAIDSELERIQIQQDLEISELKYRELMENSPEGITIYVDGKIAYINKEAMRLMRATEKEELMGKTIVDFIHPDNQALVLERMQYVAMVPLYSILPSVEEKYIRLDGTEVFVEIKVMPILYDGKPAMQLSGHDISDRKNAEMALADTMTELKTIYDSAPVMMCVVDENANIQFANQAFASLSESVLAELKGEKIGDIVGCVNSLNNGCGFGNTCGNCGLTQFMLNTLTTGIGHSNIEHKSTVIRNGETVNILFLASTALILTGKTKRLLLCLVDITNRKQAEEALQKSEEKYRLLAENMHDGILSFGADNKINYVSASYIKQLGYSEKTQLDKGVTDIFSIIHPEDRDEVFANIFDAIEKKKPQLVYSYRVKHFLGHYIWREDSTKFNYDDDGNYAGAYLVCRDITIRKQTQEALQLSEIHLNNLFEFSPISIWEEDFSEIKNYFDELKGQGIADFREFLTSNPHEVEKLAMLIKVAKVNETSVKIFGADTKEELISSLPFAFSHINVPVFLEEFVALAEGKIHFEGETQIDTLKGEKRNFWLNLTVMPDYEDTLSKVLVTFIDITERKQAEDALQKSEMFLRTFIDNTPFEIWARDVNNIGILENKKVVDHYGSILGKQPNELSIQDRKLVKTWESQNVRVFKGEMIDEVVEFKENKELLFYQKISFPIINKSEIIGIAGFNIDITERKRADEALRISQVQLKQFAAHLQDVREEEKKILAREIHDELGQILVALKIDLGLLKQKVVRKFEDTDPGDLITKFDHLYVLVDDTIKTTRKIMTNLRPEVLDLLGFIEAVKSYSREFKERHRIECEFTCSVSELEINSQQSMALFRIVQESLTNVAKHAKATSVKISLDFLKEQLIMKIVDNGVGFDELHKGRSDSYGMIGMKERVFLLDGELSIVGTLGKGTSVKVSIPYK